MQQRLAHQVEIEELYLAPQTVGQGVELLECEPALLSVGLGTEQAVKVTDVCYFKIATRYHWAVSYINDKKYTFDLCFQRYAQTNEI